MNSLESFSLTTNLLEIAREMYESNDRIILRLSARNTANCRKLPHIMIIKSPIKKRNSTQFRAFRGEYIQHPDSGDISFERLRSVFNGAVLPFGHIAPSVSPGIAVPDVNLVGDFSVSRWSRRRLSCGQRAERARRRLQMRGLSTPQMPTRSTADGGEGHVFRDPR